MTEQTRARPDPVAAALDVAGEAAFIADGNDDTYREIAAAAVSAFLRALPKVSVMMADIDAAKWHSTTTLASAVERAAREGGA